MSRTVFSINSKTYQIALKDSVPTGGRQFAIEQQAWQPGDPAEPSVAVWKSDGPGLFSYEETDEAHPTGYLGIEYGCDSRWSDTLTLPPLLSTITLTGFDTPHPETLLDVSALLDQNTGLDGSPTAGNVTAIAMSPDATGATQYLYFARGNYVTKVNAATLAVVSTTAFLDTVTDLIATQTPSNVREVSAALQASAYQVATPIATGAVDTWAANSSGEIARVFGKDPQRIVEGQLSSGVTNWRGNILAGAATMLAPVWNTVASIVGGPQLIPTGFTTDGYRWICATSSGPYVLDPQLGSLYALLPTTDNNPENGRNVSFWEFLGAIIPGRYGIRWQKANQGRSFGVESFEGNRSPVTGYPTAQDGSTRWHYEVVQNTSTSTAWLVAFHPDNRETRPNRVMSPFVIGKIPSSAVSRAMKWVGTANQQRTTPVVVMGNGTNALSMLVGETPQEIDDTNYKYALTDTAYFTELRRFQHSLKDVEAISFEVANATVNRTIAVAMKFSGDIGQPTTVSLAGTTAGVNDTISTNGYQRRLFVTNAGVPLTTATGRRLQPQLTFLTNDSSQSPQIIGDITVHYTLRPITVDQVTVYLHLENFAGRTAYDQAQELMALQDAAPTLVDDDYWGDTYYVRVVDARIPPELKNEGASNDRPRDGGEWIVPVVMRKWLTSGTGVTP